MASFSTLEKIQCKHYDNGHLPFTLENRKIRFGNHMIRAIPSGTLQKTFFCIF